MLARNVMLLLLGMLHLPYLYSFKVRSIAPESRIEENTKIHIFGDSHAYHFFSDNYVNDYLYSYAGKKETLQVPFSVHWLGAKTMHGLSRHGTMGLNIRQYGVQNGDVVVFTCGEIDVRCHIGKQRDQNGRTLDEIVDSLVAAYISLILENRRRYLRLQCVVMGIIPPCNACFNPEFPFYGSLADRVTITNVINAKLQRAALANDMLFISVHDLLALPDGSLNTALSDNCVHISMHENYRVKNKLIAALMGELF